MIICTIYPAPSVGEELAAQNEPFKLICIGIMNQFVSALNQLTADLSPQEISLWWAGETRDVDSIRRLIDMIIPDILALSAARPDLKVNEQVIAELDQLKLNPFVSPTQVMKILGQCEVPGIKLIEFISDNEGSHVELLSELNYPHDLVPAAYNCSIFMTIMTDPCRATPSEFVDRLVTKKTTFNPFNRQPWDESIETDRSLLEEINLFIKKVEWLCYAFNHSEHYRNLYLEETIQNYLQDKNCSFPSFAEEVSRLVALDMTNPKKDSKPVFFSPVKEKILPLPAKYILDLFAKYEMHTFRPSTSEYEKLLRKIVGVGDHASLSRLLSSVILDVVKIDIYASNDKGQNVITILDTFEKKYPGNKSNYDLCRSLLLSYTEPTAGESNTKAR